MFTLSTSDSAKHLDSFIFIFPSSSSIPSLHPFILSSAMIDPLSGASKPLPPPEILESRIRRPLQFAATFVPPEQLTNANPTRRHREIERVPGVPLDGQTGPGSVSEAKDEIARLLADVKRLNIGATSGDAHRLARPVPSLSAVGSSEWIESRIEALIFDTDTTTTAASTLDLGGLGMRVLTDKIAELQDMTRLAKRPVVGYEDPRGKLGIQRGAGRFPGNGQGRQFKRYTSAPVTVGTTTSRPAPVQPTPRAVSGPTQQARPNPRTRSSLRRELSTVSSASSTGGDAFSWSRVPSSSAGSALGEGDSFASTSTAVSDMSAGTLVDVNGIEEFSANAKDKGKGASVPQARRLGDSASAVSHFRKMHQIQTPAASERTFTRSSSAMTTFSPTGPSVAVRRREGMNQKTVSFAQLGVAPRKEEEMQKTRTSSAAWSRSPSGTWNPSAKDSWKGDSRGDVQLILSNNSLTW